MNFTNRLFFHFSILYLVGLSSCDPKKSEPVSYAQYSLEQGDRFFDKANHGLTHSADDSTLLCYKLALGIFNHHGQWQKYIRSSKELGSHFLQLKEYDSSLFYFKHALETSLQKSDTLNVMRTNINHRIGDYYCRIGRYDSCNWYYQKVLSQRKSMLGDQALLVSKSYLAFTWYHQELNDHSTALKYLDSAYFIMKDSQNQNSLATYYNNRAFSHCNLSEYQKGFSYLDKAKSIADEVNLAENHLFRLKVYKQYGDFNFGMEKFEEAKEWYMKVIDVPLLKSNGEIVAKALAQMGKYYLEHDEKNALVFFDRSIELVKSIHGESHKRLADAYVNKGDFYSNTDDFGNAISTYNYAIKIYETELGPTSVFIANVQYKLAQTLLKQKKQKEALIHIKESINTYRKANEGNDDEFDPFSEVYKSFHLLGQINADLEKPIEAYEAYNYEIEILDKRSLFYSDQTQLNFSRIINEAYQGIMPLAVALYEKTKDDDYLKRAFEVAEKNRAQILLSNTLASKATRFAGVPDVLVENEKRLKAEIVTHNDLLSTNINQIKLENIRRAKQDLEIKYNDLLEKIAREYPGYYQLKNQAEIVAVSELQDTMSMDEITLEYFIGKDRIYTFIIGKEGFNVVSVQKEDDFENTCLRFYRSINKYNKIEFLKLSKHLYAKLIEPVEHYISETSKIHIIPHNELAYLPFGALITDQKYDNTDFSKAPYLIKNHNISYDYSSTLRSYSSRITNSGETKFVGFAPAIDKLADGLSPLKESKEEVVGISRMFDAAGKVFLSSEASEKNFRESAKAYGIVHLATHTILDKNEPERSYVYLASSNEENQNNDGKISMGESYNLDINADLLVLSSCESGFGKLIEGEGMLSFTRGFSYSGARNVMCSLWKVNDKMTKNLMVRFYKKNSEGGHFSESLRLSKLELIRDRATAFPKNWAGFILIGDEK